MRSQPAGGQNGCVGDLYGPLGDASLAGMATAPSRTLPRPEPDAPLPLYQRLAERLPADIAGATDRKRVVWGKSGSERVDLGGCRIGHKTKTMKNSSVCSTR